MASSGSSSPLALNPSDLPPEVSLIIEAFAEAIRPPIIFLLLTVIFASMLIPILITLLWLSTPATRRQPIFILNVISILIGIGIGIWSSYNDLFAILNPTVPINNTANAVVGVVLPLAPWIAELVLAYRLVVVFPPARTPRWKLAAIFAFPVAVKLARLGCNIAFWRVWFREVEHSPSPLMAVEDIGLRNFLYSRAELFLQIFDNGYLSLVFIWKLHRGHIFQSRDGQRVTFGGGRSLTSRLKMLFWIAIGNFIIPVMFSMAIAIDVLVDPNYPIHLSSLFVSNYYVSIIGVVFATVWSTSTLVKKDEESWDVKRLPIATESASTTPSYRARVEPKPVEEGLFHDVVDKTQAWPDPERATSRSDVIPLTVLVQTERTSVA
ncbi:hypothetical protein PsYK624_088620 [Phanerochaete sordida]|uniref:Uncharacterized protein n=1 Tax=Phanerochaete sordida TaxID=48140 RepID=A0A9P3GD47_9APHY|nr:hypothetical protein PsYK624_088620 [Phanerochaete sordida]